MKLNKQEIITLTMLLANRLEYLAKTDSTSIRFKEALELYDKLVKANLEANE